MHGGISNAIADVPFGTHEDVPFGCVFVLGKERRLKAGVPAHPQAVGVVVRTAPRGDGGVCTVGLYASRWTPRDAVP